MLKHARLKSTYNTGARMSDYLYRCPQKLQMVGVDDRKQRKRKMRPLPVRANQGQGSRYDRCPDRRRGAGDDHAPLEQHGGDQLEQPRDSYLHSAALCATQGLQSVAQCPVTIHSVL